MARILRALTFAAAIVMAPTLSHAQLGGLLDEVTDTIDDLVDLCADLPGIQVNLGECEDGEGDDLLDVCIDIPGIQVDIGDCDGEELEEDLLDVCLDLPGIQVDIGECEGEPGENLVDVCVDVPGVQIDIGECGTEDNGTVDVCLDVPGVQVDIGECGDNGGGDNGGGGNGGGNNGGGNNGGRDNGGADGLNAGNSANGNTAGACFYERPYFEGASFCLPMGSAALTNLGGWDNIISSIQVFGGADVRVCVDAGLTGECEMIEDSVPQLFGRWDDGISSLAL